MSQNAAPVKVCVVCKQDVSKRPRVKDAQGRYVCETCMVARAQRRAPAPRPSEQAGAPAARASDGGELVLDSIEQLDSAGAGDVYLPEGYDPSLAVAAVTAQPEPTARAREAVPAKAKGGRAKEAPRHLCRHCGYDMAGVLVKRCPECGKITAAPKDAGLLETEREVRRKVYTRPLVLMGVGFTVSLIALAVGHASLGDYAVHFVGWLLAVPIGVLTFWVCSLMFLEYDAPFHITALRLGGIYACVGIADAIGTAAGMHVFTWAGYGLLILLYITELEMEKWEAILMSFVGGIIQFILLVLLSLVAVAAFGSAATRGGGVPPSANPALVSPSDPSGTLYHDANADGLDDASGVKIPSDAVPADEYEIDEEPTPESGGGG
ncbi:MAG: hypothetical protein U0637_04765 [Phycisphaerales bacterium]